MSFVFNFFSPLFWVRLIYWQGTVCLMLANAVYILSEDRFLHRVGWLHPPQQGFGNTSERPVKAAVINFINQTRRFARAVLILVNIVFMVLCMLIG